MPFNTPSYEAIRDDLLRDIRAQNPAANIDDDSDYFMRASAIASCASGQYAHQAWIVRQMLPDTADAEYLERHAGNHRIFRRRPTAGGATAVIRGTAGTVVPAGSQIMAGGQLYTTAAELTLSSTGGSVSVLTLATGAAVNSPPQTAQLMTAQAGVSSLSLSATTGGTDAETDASLLSRLLDKLRRPPAGGNRHDYKRWALEVDGVTAAYVYPLRRGLGTVDVFVVADDGLPSSDALERVQEYIDEVRPVTAKNISVLAPKIKTIDVSYQISGQGDFDDLSRATQAAVAQYFAQLQPGVDLVLSQLEAVISDVAGVYDRKILMPSASYVLPSTGIVEWVKLGRQTVTQL